MQKSNILCLPHQVVGLAGVSREQQHLNRLRIATGLPSNFTAGIETERIANNLFNTANKYLFSEVI